MKLLGWTGTVLKYMAGVLCWLLVFGLLRFYCVFDIYDVIGGLWMKELNGELVENAMGDIAFHTGGGACSESAYLYWVRYNPAEVDLEGMPRSLTSLVDVSTWEYAGEETTITSTYRDVKHTYILYTVSDDNFILAVDR